MTGEPWVSRPKLPSRYKIRVKKIGKGWYLILPSLTGATSRPYHSWEDAKSVAFGIARGIERGDIWK